MFNKNPLTTKATVAVLSVAIVAVFSFVLFFRSQAPPIVTPTWKFKVKAHKSRDNAYNAEDEFSVSRLEVSKKQLYFLDTAYLYAIDKISGKKRWLKKINSTAVEKLTLSKNIYLTVFFDPHVDASVDYTHMSIEPKTGKEKWRLINKNRAADELLIGENLVFNKDDKTIYAYDKQNKRLIWSVKSSQDIYEMILDKNEIFYTSHHQLVVLSASTGKKKWQVNANPSVGRGIGVYVADDYVYMTEPPKNSAHTIFYSLDRRSGKKIWQYKMVGYIGSSPKIMANAVYFDSGYGGEEPDSIAETFYVLNKTTGKDIWQIKSISLDENDDGAPIEKIIKGNTMFYVADNVKNDDGISTGIKTVDLATGKQKWEFEIEVNEGELTYVSSLYYAQDKIVFKTETVGEDNIKIYCLDAKTGRQLWNYTDSSISLINVLKNHVFITTSSSKPNALILLAIDMDNGRTKWKLPIKASGPEMISSLKVSGNKVIFVTESAVENDPEPSTIYSVKL